MSVDVIGFRRYFEILEHEVGILLMSINKNANGPRTIISSEVLYADLARQAAISIYRENRCRSMNSPVYLFPTMDVLGALRFQTESDSIKTGAEVEFLELLGQTTLSIFRPD